MGDGLHERFDRTEGAPRASSDRAFGLVVGGVLTALAAWRAAGSPDAVAAALALPGAALVVAALACPRVLAPLNRQWTRLGLLLHRIVSPLVIGVAFFLVVTPVGLLMRAFGKDPLARRRDPAAASYWIPRTPPGPDPASMREQF